MDLVELIRAIGRNWKVFVPAALVALFLAIQVGTSVQAEYAAEGSVLFVGPSEVRVDPTERGIAAEQTDETDETPADEFEAVNPFLAFSGSLSTTASATARIVDGAAYHKRLADEGFVGDFVLAGAPDGPVITAFVTAPTANDADRLTARVLRALTEEVALIQGNVDTPIYQLITAQTLTVSEAERLTGKRDRVLVGSAALGLAAAVGAAVANDARRSRRRRKTMRVDEAEAPEQSREATAVGHAAATAESDEPGTSRKAELTTAKRTEDSGVVDEAETSGSNGRRGTDRDPPPVTSDEAGAPNKPPWIEPSEPVRGRSGLKPRRRTRDRL